ncbi:hypothetical protein AN477_14385 [Alicyclobacillus ferrooxydans]|uniref:IclR family transcriptional regulator n=1 Tax=Alicyclobacillus ferrooxydans TaxID=471514 RepID=A0A0P9EJH0_9BACL|nr:hypothetical protein AN477_14385 [Alicyclobacillus ferrooxydans]
MNSVIGKVVTILKELRHAEAGTSASELARVLNMPGQTVHRLLKELGEGGLVWQDSVTKRWSLGPILIGLGEMARKQVSLIALTHPYLESLTNETRETTILTVREGNYGVYVDIIESPQRIRLVEYVGARWPLHVGCSRRAILAFLGEDEITEFAEIHCQNESQRKQLISECHDIRERGYAISLGEVTPDSFGVAAPIVYGNVPVASIMAGGPKERMGGNELDYFGELVRRIANEVSSTFAGSK